MNGKFCDDVWKRQGISLIWDPTALSSFCRSDQVISLQQFFQLSNQSWPEEPLAALMVGDGRALVVAGLETALDAQDSDKVVDWVEQTLYPVMRRFQQDVADGGRGAALIFWMVAFNRVVASSTDPDYGWITKDRTDIELSRALFNGASKDLRPIFRHESDDRPIGLYHPRIS